jgi:hypothetical protein
MGNPPQRWLSLLAAVSVIAVIWLVLLPPLSHWAPVRARIRFLHEQQIDPAACFYTDLDRMPRIEADLDSARRADPGAFWGLGGP